jgi:hypothetical protein
MHRSQPGSTHRPRRRPRVEQLEERNLLSSITRIVRDGDGNLFALSATGNVYEQVLGTGSWTQVGSGDNSLVSDATGNVFTLNASTGGVYEHVLDSGWNWV